MLRRRRCALVLALVAALAVPVAANARPAGPARTAGGGLTTTLVCAALGTGGAKSAYKRLGELVTGSRLRPAAMIAGVLGLAASTCKQWLPRARSWASGLLGQSKGPAPAPPPRDLLPPAVLPPGAAVVAGSTLDANGRVLVRAFWTSFDASGVSENEVDSSLNGTFGRAANVGTSTWSDWWLAQGRQQFAVRARDRIGNVGDWTYGAQFTLSLVDTVALPGWPLFATAGAYGGYVAGTGAPGAWRDHSFLGTGGAVVAPTGPGYGRAEFSIDGRPDSDVDLGSLAPAASRVVYSVAGLPPGRHTIRVRDLTGFVAVDAYVAVTS